MCGINGVLYSKGLEDDSIQLVNKMNDLLISRGRDGVGLWADDRIVLGHRRLSIVDLSSSGNQPMMSLDGSCIMVCNGEIYNYKELKKIFLKEGYVFKGSSDSEVILPLYLKYREKFVQHLSGMFSIAIWDLNDKTLILARDRIGQKPLYYSSAQEKFAFSSEPKGLLALDFVDKTLDEEAIPLLMVHKTLPAPITMFKGIRALPPAHYMVIKDGYRRLESYWSIDYSKTKNNIRTDNLLEEYEELLIHNVSSCLDTDVPTGVMLSGGVDSSTVAAIACKNKNELMTFGLGADGDDEEVLRAKYAANILNTKHTSMHYKNLDYSEFPRLIKQYDQPIWAQEILFADVFSRVISENVKVALTGNGADEVFGGYSLYRYLKYRQHFGQLLKLFPKNITINLARKVSDSAYRFAKASQKSFPTWQGEISTLLSNYLMSKLCTKSFQNRWSNYKAGKYMEQVSIASNPRTLLDAVRYSDLMVNHQHGHSVIPDISGMYNGLEYRSPFLDHKIIEFSARLPGDQIISWPYGVKNTKSIMKKYLTKHFSTEFVYAPKMGFGKNITSGNHSEIWRNPYVREKILNGKYLELDIFTPNGAEWALKNSKIATMQLLSFSTWFDLNSKNLNI